MNTIHFKPAVLADAAEIARLVNSAYRPASGEGGWTHESNLLSGPRTSPRQVHELICTSTVIVGVIGCSIVACAHISVSNFEARIGMLAVAPSLQASGVGKKLLAFAEKHASVQLDAAEFVLVVGSARSELIEFYRRRGYERTGIQLEYPEGSGVGTPISGALSLAVLRKCSGKLSRA